MTNTIIQELAKQYIIKHNYDYATLNKHYGTGLNSFQVNFGYDFLVECTHQVVNELKKSTNPEKEIREIIKHFAQAASAFNNSEFSYGIYYLKKELITNFSEFFENYNTIKSMKPSIQSVIVEAIKENENSSSSKIKFVTEMLEIKVLKSIKHK